MLLLAIVPRLTASLEPTPASNFRILAAEHGIKEDGVGNN